MHSRLLEKQKMAVVIEYHSMNNINIRKVFNKFLNVTLAAKNSLSLSDDAVANLTHYCLKPFSRQNMSYSLR